MTDETQNTENTEETPAAEETPVAEETPAVEEAATETPTAEETPASEEEASAETEEAPAEEAPAEEAPAGEETSPEAPAAEGETEEPAAEAAPAEPEQAAGPEPKRKKKRLPRGLRRQRSKPQRERPAERKPIARLPKPESERGRRQERRGVVVSDAMDKTIVVKVDTIKAHPRYKKVVRRSAKFHAHDEENQAKVGDVVRIIETRPLSKTKNWRLAEVVEAAK